MAALPYMQLYVADYLADTMHLTTEEHGAYLLIIFNYWQTGKPIPKSRLPKIARLSNERWTSVESSLNEFFNDNGTEWIHERIECDLATVKVTQDQRIAAGKASAEARKQAKKAEISKAINDSSTDAQRPLNEIEEIREEEINSKALVDGCASTGGDLFDSQPDAPKSVKYGEVQNAYNEICGEFFPKCSVMNEKRKSLIRKAADISFDGFKPFKEHGLPFWEAYFADCIKNAHWCGRNDRGWRASFDFVLRMDNVIKVLEEQND